MRLMTIRFRGLVKQVAFIAVFATVFVSLQFTPMRGAAPEATVSDVPYSTWDQVKNGDEVTFWSPKYNRFLEAAAKEQMANMQPDSSTWMTLTGKGTPSRNQIPETCRFLVSDKKDKTCRVQAIKNGKPYGYLKADRKLCIAYIDTKALPTDPDTLIELKDGRFCFSDFKAFWNIERGDIAEGRLFRIHDSITWDTARRLIPAPFKDGGDFIIGVLKSALVAQEAPTVVAPAVTGQPSVQTTTTSAVINNPADFSVGYNASWKLASTGNGSVIFDAQSANNRDLIVYFTPEAKDAPVGQWYSVVLKAYGGDGVIVRKGDVNNVVVNQTTSGGKTKAGLSYWVSIETQANGNVVFAYGNGRDVGADLIGSWVDTKNPIKNINYIGLGAWKNTVNYSDIVTSAQAPAGFEEEVGMLEQVSIGATPDGKLFVVGLEMDGDLVVYDPGTMAENPWGKEIVVGGKTISFATLKKADGATIAAVKYVAAAADGTFGIVADDGKVYLFDWTKQVFIKVAELPTNAQITFEMLAIGNKYEIYAVDFDAKKIYKHNGKGWVEMPKSEGLFVSVGYDGAVVALNSMGRAYMLLNGIWKEMGTMELDRIAVASKDYIVGLSDGVMHEWTGKDWKSLGGSNLDEIAVNGAKRVMLLGADGSLFNRGEAIWVAKITTTVPVPAKVVAGKVVASAKAAKLQVTAEAVPSVKGALRTQAKKTGKINVKAAKKAVATKKVVAKAAEAKKAKVVQPGAKVVKPVAKKKVVKKLPKKLTSKAKKTVTKKAAPKKTAAKAPVKKTVTKKATVKTPTKTPVKKTIIKSSTAVAA